MSLTSLPQVAAVQASTHLHLAADGAEALAVGDIFSAWSALAGQIRLVASAIDPTVYPLQPPSTSSVQNCLTRALNALDEAPAGPDVLIWIWHVSELRRLTDQLTTLP